jgi:membrane fusion protein, heavy metal efflux system
MKANRLFPLILAAVIMPGSPYAGAATIEITAELLERYGATLANPLPDATAVVVTGEGYVVAPPASERVIVAHTAGLVEQVLVSTGEVVAVGTPLIRIGGGAIVEMQGNYLAAAREAARAHAQLERDIALHAEGIISERRLQETRDRVATASVAREQLALELELTGLDAPARKALAESGRAQPGAVLRAPQAGTVTEIVVRPGERLDPDRPVGRIVDLERLWLELRVGLPDARRLRVGMAARQPGSADPIGEVIGVLPLFDEHIQTALVRIALREGAGLALGAFVTAELLESASASAGLMRIPAQALLREGEHAEVFIVSGTRLERRPVQLVGASGRDAWVTGLTGSDRIVVAGTAALRALHEEAVAEETP